MMYYVLTSRQRRLQSNTFSTVNCRGICTTVEILHTFLDYNIGTREVFVNNTLHEYLNYLYGNISQTVKISIRFVVSCLWQNKALTYGKILFVLFSVLSSTFTFTL